jgi:hypothetical protein
MQYQVLFFLKKIQKGFQQVNGRPSSKKIVTFTRIIPPNLRFPTIVHKKVTLIGHRFYLKRPKHPLILTQNLKPCQNRLMPGKTRIPK